MKLFLNNIIKGLLTAIVVICLGGFISLNIKMPPSNVLVFVSSSVMNSINTESDDNAVVEEKTNDEEKDVEVVTKEETQEETIEIQEENTNSTKENNVQNSQESNNPETKEENNGNLENDSKEDESQVNDIQEEITIQGEYAPNLEVLNTITVIATYQGKITAYGPDCVGCSGITASGRNVLNGNIYYDDTTFGSVRIVAADRSIPFGSIVKITGINISSDPILAIVLDRGGMIGFAEGKHAYFDLLYPSEKDTYSFGRQNATFELLRTGY